MTVPVGTVEPLFGSIAAANAMLTAVADNYHENLCARHLSPVLRGVWSMIGHSEREFGWKLHLSSVPHEAIALIDAVVPVLTAFNVSYKVVRDAGLLGMLNEGSLGDTQVGKFATIYPADDEEAVSLADALIAATAGFHGPVIVSDLYLGGTVYTRYGPFSPRMVRDRLGLFEPEDARQPAGYAVPFVAPPDIANPFARFARPADEPSARTAPIGPGYLIVEPLQRHSKGAVLKALDLRSQADVGLVVLKEGRPYCLCDTHGRDMGDRLRNQAAAHEALGGKAPVPRADPVFEHAGSLYLPLAFVEGRDFGSRPAMPYGKLKPGEQQGLLCELLTVTEAIGELHAAGYVHRDLSMRNVRITPEGRAVFIDLEISHRLDDDAPPFSQGTAGFVSPQQLADGPASVTDDIFALGSMIVCATTGLDPQRVLYAATPRRAAQLEALSGMPAALARITAACIAEEPDARPALDRVAATIRACLEGFAPTRGVAATDPDYLHLSREGLRWLIDGAVRDEANGMWRSPDLGSGQHANLKLVHSYQVYRNANRGVAGVVYAIAKLHRFGITTPGAKARVESAIDWLLDHQPTPDDQMAGLHFGEAGVAVSIAEAIAGDLIERGPWLRPYMEEALSGPLDWPDLTHGAAGQGLAAFACADLLGEPGLASFADRCADYLCAEQRDDGAWMLPDGVRAMSHAVYTGYAHGVAGMTAFLAQYARRTGSAQASQAAARAGQWLIDEARPANTMSLWWPVRIDEADVWRWWCHGAPGIAMAFLDLYALTSEARYAAAARACLRTHPVEVRHPNMSQCHGLSGLGEIMLEAHLLLGEAEWRERAEAIGRLLANLARADEDGASWLVENPYQATPDLMIGSGGIVHFLARLGLNSPWDFRFPLNPAPGRRA